MKPLFYSAPIILPRPNGIRDPEIRSGMEQFCKRAIELWRAAALIHATEPGLLTSSDREAARRRGLAAGRRLMKESPKGRARVLYFRALTEYGLHADLNTISALASRIWLLEDRFGLANSYLRAIADTALQNQTDCILCQNPIRREQLEAVFLPNEDAAYLSMNIIKSHDSLICHQVHLDRIPDSARKQAMKGILNENRKMADILTRRAAEQLRNAAILRDLKANTCVVAERPL